MCVGRPRCASGGDVGGCEDGGKSGSLGANSTSTDRGRARGGPRCSYPASWHMVTIVSREGRLLFRVASRGGFFCVHACSPSCRDKRHRPQPMGAYSRENTLHNEPIAWVYSTVMQYCSTFNSSATGCERIYDGAQTPTGSHMTTR